MKDKELEQTSQTLDDEAVLSAEESVQDEMTLSDDELYAKIQTEKMLRKKKRKRIVTICCLCVAMALAMVIIILGAVPVSLKPYCLRSGFSQIKLYGSGAVVSYDSDDEGYSTFMKYYNKAFSQTYLSAIFSGSLFSYEITEEATSLDSSTLVSTMQGLAGDSNYLVQLIFDEDQVFTYQSGKTYESRYYSYQNYEITFSQAFIVVNESSGLQSTDIYIVAKYPVFSGKEPTGETKLYLITVTVKADTNIIYEAWSELTDM